MTSFYKLSGAGNDFLALVEPETPPATEQIRAWCRRRQALGADGLFTLARQDKAVRMVHYNADGRRSDLCLNGSRCAVQLAAHLGWTQRGCLALVTDVGELATRQHDEQKVELALPPFIGTAERRTLTVGNDAYEGFFVEVGVPHFVLPWQATLADVPIPTLGPALRSHPDLGTAGANVQFVRFVSRDHFEIRSYERGVEGETLACGTGAVASCAVGAGMGRLDLPSHATTAGGFVLTVDGRFTEGHLSQVTLTGDARLVAKGDLLPGALTVPDAIGWSS